MTAPIVAVVFAAAFGSGLAGGVFFAFSTFTIDGIDRLPPPVAVEAMKAINVAAPRAPLMVLLFGTAALCVVVAVAAVVDRAAAASWLALAGALLYLAGAIVVTIGFNVPLNESLDATPAGAAHAAEAWDRYLPSWRAWNHVRTLSSATASAALIASLVAR